MPKGPRGERRPIDIIGTAVALHGCRAGPILNMLVEGSSMRSISRVADVSYNTVAALLKQAGEACHEVTSVNVVEIRVAAEAANEMAASG